VGTRILTHLAKAVSIIFHPLLLPSYAVPLILLTNPYMFGNLDQETQLRMIIIVFINTFVFPVVVIFLLKQLNFIKSYALGEKNERHIPLIAISIFFFWCYMVFGDMPISNFLPNLLLGASIAVFASFFINIFFKISIHTVAAGYLVGIAFELLHQSTYNLESLLLLSIVIAGLVGSARMYLEAHLWDEVVSGYLIGILCYMVIFYLI
jgi:membrane-associated phospholipid phosphatase